MWFETFARDLRAPRNEWASVPVGTIRSFESLERAFSSDACLNNFLTAFTQHLRRPGLCRDKGSRCRSWKVWHGSAAGFAMIFLSYCLQISSSCSNDSDFHDSNGKCRRNMTSSRFSRYCARLSNKTFELLHLYSCITYIDDFDVEQFLAGNLMCRNIFNVRSIIAAAIKHPCSFINIRNIIA